MPSLEDAPPRISVTHAPAGTLKKVQSHTLTGYDCYDRCPYLEGMTAKGWGSCLNSSEYFELMAIYPSLPPLFVEILLRHVYLPLLVNSLSDCFLSVENRCCRIERDLSNSLGSSYCFPGDYSTGHTLRAALMDPKGFRNIVTDSFPGKGILRSEPIRYLIEQSHFIYNPPEKRAFPTYNFLDFLTGGLKKRTLLLESAALTAGRRSFEELLNAIPNLFETYGYQDFDGQLRESFLNIHPLRARSGVSLVILKGQPFRYLYVSDLNFLPMKNLEIEKGLISFRLPIKNHSLALHCARIQARCYGAVLVERTLGSTEEDLCLYTVATV